MTRAEQCIGSRSEAEGFVTLVCFKHGPPTRFGVELEWTVHHLEDPRRPLDATDLRAALGDHAPGTLVPDSPQLPLAHGSDVTVEPGGQVEISSRPFDSVPGLIAAMTADSAQLARMLAAQGLRTGSSGLDPDKTPRRILDVPRYAAMQTAFDKIGPDGSRMMCSTASLQVCLDAGEPTDTPQRWRAVHALGPALVALFANSPRPGWASARQRATFGTYPPYTEAPELSEDTDPAEGWARLAMEAPVICLRREGDCWDAPDGLSFGAWADGALDSRPTYDDLEYHLSTLFPPVRPRGHLEVRYLDAQPGDGWVLPTVLLAALTSERLVLDKVLEACEPAADRWLPAARIGLADDLVLRAAREVVELGCRSFDLLGLDPATATRIADRLDVLLNRWRTTP